MVVTIGNCGNGVGPVFFQPYYACDLSYTQPDRHGPQTLGEHANTCTDECSSSSKAVGDSGQFQLPRGCQRTRIQPRYTPSDYRWSKQTVEKHCCGVWYPNVQEKHPD